MHDGRPEVEQHYAVLSEQLARTAPAQLSNNPEQNKKVLESFKIEGDGHGATYNQTISRLYVGPEVLGGFTQYQVKSWEELAHEHERNQDARVRCVGLVVETRPDNISEAEVIRMRRLGCTKTQLGFQSLNDSVLRKNKRGHQVSATRRAVALLRQAGFKIHAHWMANLHGSSVSLDKIDYEKLFSDPDFCPDELKIYPCSLIGSAELLQYYKKGLWQPYSYAELLEVLSHCLLATPEYCRLTRVIRDIPSTDIVEGNKLTNFRQIAETKLAQAGLQSRDIRAREIKNATFVFEDLVLKSIIYPTSVSTEVFLQYVLPAESVGAPHDKIVGFLRLSLPNKTSYIAELEGSALIREVHVYGRLQNIGESISKKAQHIGLGTRLLQAAERIAQKKGYSKIAVISAIGTRPYYAKRGYSLGELYQTKVLT